MSPDGLAVRRVNLGRWYAEIPVSHQWSQTRLQLHGRDAPKILHFMPWGILLEGTWKGSSEIVPLWI